VLAELLGYVSKTKTDTKVEGNTSKVMLVKDKGDDNSWQEALQANQRKITGAL